MTARGVVLINNEIVIEKYNKYDFYSLPGGGIEQNESPQDAFLKEIEEETGYKYDILFKLPIIVEYRKKVTIPPKIMFL